MSNFLVFVCSPNRCHLLSVLFVLMAVVRYCVIHWHRPRSDLVLVLLWNIKCRGIEEEVLNECFRGMAGGLVPPTVNLECIRKHWRIIVGFYFTNTMEAFVLLGHTKQRFCSKSVRLSNSMFRRLYAQLCILHFVCP